MTTDILQSKYNVLFIVVWNLGHIKSFLLQSIIETNMKTFFHLKFSLYLIFWERVYIERRYKILLGIMLGFRTSEFSPMILFFILKSPFIMRFVFIHAKMTFCFFSKLHLIPSNNNQITRLMTHDKASKVFRSKFFFVLSCRFTAVIIFLRPRTSKI